MDYIEEQMSLFDNPENKPKPGDWVESHGAELTFDQIADRIGQMIVMDKSTENHEWFKLVTVEKIIQNEGMRRLIYYDGCRQRGLVNEIYFERNEAKSYLPA